MLTAPARLAAFTTRITAAGFYFLAFIPFVGGIILLVFLLLPPNPQGARFDR